MWLKTDHDLTNFPLDTLPCHPHLPQWQNNKTKRKKDTIQALKKEKKYSTKIYIIHKITKQNLLPNMWCKVSQTKIYFIGSQWLWLASLWAITTPGDHVIERRVTWHQGQWQEMFVRVVCAMCVPWSHNAHAEHCTSLFCTTPNNKTSGNKNDHVKSCCWEEHLATQQSTYACKKKSGSISFFK